jgi:hypothetical protein
VLRFDAHAYEADCVPIAVIFVKILIVPGAPAHLKAVVIYTLILGS